MSRRILITGGAGFIGSNFVHFLLNESPVSFNRIVVLDCLTYAGNLGNLADVMEKIVFVKGNICNSELVAHIMKTERIDTIAHFAAESHVDRSILNPGDFISTNVLGTQVLLDCARQAGVELFLHVSTDEVFGSLELDSKERFSETTPYNPHSAYSVSKAASDRLVRVAFHSHGLPVMITNCSNNYGPRQFPEKLIPLFITNLLDGKKVPLYGDGLNVRDWLHVKDHCRALALVMEKGKIGETYCIGGNNERSNLEITGLILKAMGFDESMIERVADRKGHDRRYAIDSSKIQRELGWRPLDISFEQGLAHTIDWYRENENWWRKIKSGEYLKYYQQVYGK